MRKALVVLAIAALAATVASAVTTSPGHRINGAVRDLSCPGPCRRPPHPPLYTGNGLTVKVKRLVSSRLVAVKHPRDGRFRVAVARGRYRVSADVAGRCWTGSRRRVRVRGKNVHVRLTVKNDCLR